MDNTWRFNSLQTGKYVARDLPNKSGGLHHRTFQFPSNGKVCSKPRTVPPRKSARRKKFQFPSNGKVCSKPGQPVMHKVIPRFNSLQTGKYVASDLDRSDKKMLAKSFNSLQTGKYVASEIYEFQTWYEEKFQFPSNGKVCSKARLHI